MRSGGLGCGFFAPHRVSPVSPLLDEGCIRVGLSFFPHLLLKRSPISTEKITTRLTPGAPGGGVGRIGPSSDRSKVESGRTDHLHWSILQGPPGVGSERKLGTCEVAGVCPFGLVRHQFPSPKNDSNMWQLEGP